MAAEHIEAASARPGSGLWDALSLLEWRLRRVIKRPLYALYERRLAAQSREWCKPQHVGIIMDGNRRFARSARMSRLVDGHRAGADRLHKVIEWCDEFGVRVVTVWALSLDNLGRGPQELAELFALITLKLREFADHPMVHRRKVRLRYIGRPDGLPDELRAAIAYAESATADHDGLILNVALGYGGREEITDAFRAHIRRQAEMGQSAAAIADSLEPDCVDSYLYNAGLPEPELIMRTSGELRLSGFLLWQSVYSEFYFCDVFWPDFRRVDFLCALRAFHRRQRRFGR